jgi:putative ABC transport system ATP-binding protein
MSSNNNLCDGDNHDHDDGGGSITMMDNEIAPTPTPSPPSPTPPSLLLLPYEKQVGPDSVVKLKGIYKHYKISGREDTVRALENINLCDEQDENGEYNEFFAVKRGEFVMIRGPSGGGKTTLLNIIGTIDKPSGGTLEILGELVNEKSTDNYLADLRLRRIGFVFQTFNLIATMSAFENVELPMTLLGRYDRRQRRQRAKDLLKMVGLEDRMSHLPSELSGGEQQRVTIARSLANEPEILLLDEPTGDLDTRNTVEIMDLLLNINLRQKTTMIMVTHNPDVECYADRILYVNDGRFVKQYLNQIQTPLIYEKYDSFLKNKK